MMKIGDREKLFNDDVLGEFKRTEVSLGVIWKEIEPS